MTHLITKVMLTGLIVASTHLYAENYDFKPGLWETTWKSEIVEIDAPPEMEKMMRSMAKRPDYTEAECINDIAIGSVLTRWCLKHHALALMVHLKQWVKCVSMGKRSLLSLK